MKLIWHIFLKDLRRLAPALGLLVLLMAGGFVTGWLALNGNGVYPDALSQLKLVANFFLILEVAANFFLVALLIGEDSVRTTSAFWLTRPISGGRLLAAKLLGIVVMCGVLPVLVSLPWWLLNGYGAPELISATCDTVFWHALVVLVPLLLAVLTNGLPRLILWTGVTWVVVVTWWIVAGTTSGRSSGVTPAVVWSRSAVSLALLAAGIAAVVVMQYRTRRIERSLAITGGFVATMLAIAAMWPWDLAAPWNRLSHRTGAAPAPLAGHPAFRFEYQAAHGPAVQRKPASQNLEMVVQLALRGMPRDRTLSFLAADQTWSWPDGTIFNSASARVRSRLARVDPGRHPQLRDAAGAGTSDSADADEEPVNLGSVVTRSLGERMPGDPPSYVAELTYALARPEALFETSLQSGERLRHGSFSARVALVTGATPNDQVRFINVVTSAPAFVRFDALLMHFNPFFQPQAEIFPVFVNRGGPGWGRSMGDGRPTPDVIVGTVAINWRSLQVPPGPADRLTDATIVWMTLRDFERYRQTLRVERFEVRP